MVVLIYPNQLYDLKYWPKDWSKHKIYLLEEPVYWGTDTEVQFNMNQLKLVLHRASMKYYYDLLKKQGYDVTYVEEKDLKKGYNFLKKRGKKVSNNLLHYFDPTDYRVLEKIGDEAEKYGYTTQMHETPNFLHTVDSLETYIDANQKDGKKDNGFFHATFYTWSKKQLKLNKIIGDKSYDSENRDSLPQGVTIPELPKGDQKTKWVVEAIDYVKKNYGQNYGKADTFYLPVTHKSSEKWFEAFLQERFMNFGNYQDAITKRNGFLFHSVMSPMLNVGLLDIEWVVSQTINYYEKHKDKIGKNDFEGFLRQILGWREYSRMLYLFAYDRIKGNYFGNNRKLTPLWYDGEVGIEPVDWSIKTAFDTGYLHHILRLMMMANFMNLVGLHPDEIFKWFMEFSLDSYQWVMHNNVYGMGTYADGGFTMRKPYLSSSNYILKMSDFKKDGYWDKIWTDLFYRFLAVNEEKLKGTPYLRNLAYYKKKSPEEQKALLDRANKFISKVTAL